MSSQTPIILWFRQDLRLADNPALQAAAETGAPLLPVYILDDDNAGDRKMGAASRVWLYHALSDLNNSLDGQLYLAKGNAAQIISTLTKETEAQAVYWNRCYEPWRIDRDTKIKKDLESQNIDAKSFNGSLLWEPWDVLKNDGTPYKVFTPFYKKGCLSKAPPREPLPTPKNLNYFEYKSDSALDDLNLLPPAHENGWEKTIIQNWDISEQGAQQRLHDFLKDGLQNYKDGRNEPAGNNVSRLSPYLHFGQISPNTAWYAAQERGTMEGWERDRDHFLSELSWREFSYSLLYHFPTLPWENLQPRFNDFPWHEERSGDLKKWQQGQTGYPIVDAAMRELYETGYMHNRTRMIVGSFLVKNLLIHWHRGEEWFWDCLFDADLANNSASWQWIAGCGADAAPYFRIFNPITQGEKFDPDGAYVRRFVPELKDMPKEYIHKPWEAPPLTLQEAGVELGKTYPHPIVDHKEAREKALKAFEQTKKAA